jgi:hypothetical protein
LRLIRYSSVFFTLFLASVGNCQLFDDFSDLDFTFNPIWVGDTTDFTVNSDSVLQLSNPGMVSSSYLSTPFSYNSSDSLEWRFYLDQSFSPSGSNFSRIYLAADSANLDSAQNAYYMQFGESGSNDAIELFERVNGIDSSICRAPDAEIAGSFEVDIRVRKDPLGNWTIERDFSTTQNYTLAASGSGDSLTILSHFGWSCVYTSSNSEKMFLDNVYGGPWEFDTTAPSCISFSILSDSTLQLVFNEELDSASVINALYSLNPTTGAITPLWSDSVANQIELLFSQTFNTQAYTLSYSGITDKAGNSVGNESKSFFFYDLQLPEIGDIIINEVLYNPIGSGSDYVEIKNISDKLINLNGFALANYDDDTISNLRTFTQDFYLWPDSIAVFSKDSIQVKSDYFEHGNANFLELSSLPSYPNDSGTVYLLFDSTVLDKVSYEDYWQFDLLSSSDGVSLERIDPFSPSNDENNWHSAASTIDYGSPGKENSQAFTDNSSGTEFIFLSRSYLSPDNDGIEDFLPIQLNFNQPGFIYNLKIYDLAGQVLRTLEENKLAGNTENINWDGKDELGNTVLAGNYILVLDYFDLDGNQKLEKKVVSVLIRL